MTTRFFGAPVKRNEDRKLLTGQGLFIDDVELPGMLHVAFLRSQVAHARIKSIDVSRALQRSGVVAPLLSATSCECASCTSLMWVMRRAVVKLVGNTAA